MTAIVLRTENGKPFLEGDWPDETLIMQGLIDTSPYVSRQGNTIVFEVSNGDAIYKAAPPDTFGRITLTKIRASRRMS